MAFNPNIKLAIESDKGGGAGDFKMDGLVVGRKDRKLERTIASKREFNREKTGDFGALKMQGTLASKKEVRSSSNVYASMDTNGNLMGGLTMGSMSISTKKASFGKDPKKDQKRGRTKDRSRYKPIDGLTNVEDPDKLFTIAPAPASQLLAVSTPGEKLLTSSAPSLTATTAEEETAKRDQTNEEKEANAEETNDATKDTAENDDGDDEKKEDIQDTKDAVESDENRDAEVTKPKKSSLKFGDAEEIPGNIKDETKPKKSALKFGDAEEIPDKINDETNATEATAEVKAGETLQIGGRERRESVYENKDSWDPGWNPGILKNTEGILKNKGTGGILKNRKHSVMPASDKPLDLKVIGAPKITIDPAEDVPEQKKKKKKKRIKFAAKEREGDIYPWPE